MHGWAETLAVQPSLRIGRNWHANGGSLFIPVLLVEDDVVLAQAITTRLSQAGYCVVLAPSAHFAVMLARRLEPRAVILSLALREASGLRVLAALRQHEVTVPIIALAATAEPDAERAALEAGAAALLSHAAVPSELIPRLRQLIEPTPLTSRASLSRAGEHRFDDVVVSVATRQVTRGGLRIPLTSREYDLLLCLLRRRGAVVSRSELLHEVWRGARGDLRAVDRHILTLRRKLEPDPARPRYILTAWKAGYRFGGRIVAERSQRDPAA